MDLETTLTILAALGGFESVKWCIQTLINRKTEKRKQHASVHSIEQENERTKTDWLEQRLNQRDTRIDALSLQIRKLEAEKLDLIQEKHEIEMKLQAAEFRKCEVRGCGNRKPPTGF